MTDSMDLTDSDSSAKLVTQAKQGKVRKMTAVTTAPVQSQEELEAAEAEQIVRISSEGLKKVRRLHKLRAAMKQLETEEKEIKEFLTEEMVEKNAKALAFKGVPAVALEDTTQVKTNSKQLFVDHPELEAIYVTRNPDAVRFALKAWV